MSSLESRSIFVVQPFPMTSALLGLFDFAPASACIVPRQALAEQRPPVIALGKKMVKGSWAWDLHTEMEGRVGSGAHLAFCLLETVRSISGKQGTSPSEGLIKLQVWDVVI